MNLYFLLATERDTFALPENRDDLIRYYTFNDSPVADPPATRRRQPPGFSALPARLPRLRAGTDSELPEPVILWVAKQVQTEPASWAKYGERDVHPSRACLSTAQWAALAPFGLSDFRAPCAS